MATATTATATNPSETTNTENKPSSTKLIIPSDLKVSDRDRKILELGDGSFVPFSWVDLVEIVKNNELSRLSRRPSDLLVYLKCKQKFQEEYGGVLPYIMKERLHWEADSETGEVIPKNPRYFGDSEDVKILYNDFPYGLEPQIVHVVVWLKAKIPTIPPHGDISTETRQEIEDYVVRTFQDHLNMSRDNILWFKNWAALQSVRALDHFHVLLNGPSKEKLGSLINTSGFL